MFTLVVAVAVLLAVGLALGRAPLFRFLVSMLAFVVWLPTAALWAAFLALVELLLRSHGHNLDGPAAAALLLLAPVLPVLFVLRWLRRRGQPRFLWRLAEQPGTLSLRGILLVQAGVLLTSVIGGNLVASGREPQVERAWSRSGHSLEALVGRYPKAPSNAEGLEVQRLAAALGIAIGRDSERARLQGKATHARVQGAVSAYVFREATRSEGPPQAPPLEVRAWLAMSAAGLGAIEQQLVRGGP